jgi:hypothetical protein
MTVDSSPVKFTPTLPGQPVPEIRTISGDRPVFRAELPTPVSSGWSPVMRTSVR